METRTNEMIVQFMSNNFLIAHGFNLTYETIQSKSSVHNDNTPIKFPEIFHGCKNGKFQ